MQTFALSVRMLLGGMTTLESPATLCGPTRRLRAVPAVPRPQTIYASARVSMDVNYLYATRELKA